MLAHDRGDLVWKRPPSSQRLPPLDRNVVVVPAGVQQHDGVAEVRAPAHHPAHRRCATSVPVSV